MVKNYFKIAWRTLSANKAYSFINIAGLAMGMSVAMLISLWVYDELSHDRSHQNYGRIAQVMQHQTRNGEVGTQNSVPYPLADELRRSYGTYFRHVVLSSWTSSHTLGNGDKKLSKNGNMIEPGAPEMLSVRMIAGTWSGLQDPYSIMLSESTARALFGKTNVTDGIVRMDHTLNLKVTGVFADLPANSTFGQMAFMTPWSLMEISNPGIKTNEDPWRPNSFQIFVQLTEQADFDEVSAAIRDVKKKHIRPEQQKFKPDVFLNPMSQWYLYSTFKNGVRVGGRIENVWLFGVIGLFVLLLACINFMNLSTARSEKRAREVGIRKAVGSVRVQLVTQFFIESLLVVFLALAVALLLVVILLPVFNEVADKQLVLLWKEPLSWVTCIGFCLVTALLAGSYPALYLSSFQPVKVLKGSYRAGRFSALPRKTLVIVQFTVSILLIIGTIVVYRQIQFAKDRPVGYTRSGLLQISLTTPDILKHLEIVRTELKTAGAITEIAAASGPVTESWSTTSGIEWKDKDPAQSIDFDYVEVSHEYGRTIGWKFVAGRDFSRDFASDSAGLVVNEAAVRFMGLKNPVGEELKWFDERVRIIGVIRDMVITSPYEPVKPLIYNLSAAPGNIMNIRINPVAGTDEAIKKIERIFKKYDPGAPFTFRFVDQDYAFKFFNEVRIARLTTFFSILAILISCLGLFGVASFIAEQRTKEIGVRKVLGATVLNVWGMLSRDFVVLVAIAFILAVPIAWYFLDSWLQSYTYRTTISWWIFAATGSATLFITLLTVSFQAIQAAMMNPIKSLKSE